MKQIVPTFEGYLFEERAIPTEMTYDNVVSAVQDYIAVMYQKYMIKYPEHKSKMKEYMEGELQMTQWSTIPFIHMLKDKHVTVNKKRPEKVRMQIRKACFYNALSYMKYYKESQPNLELAWGLIVENFASFMDDLKKYTEDPTYKMRTFLTCTLHAFNVLDGKIIDPTLPSDTDPYAYEIIPQDVWEKFNWKDNDSNFDGEDCANYIYKRVEDLQKDKKYLKLLTSKIKYEK